MRLQVGYNTIGVFGMGIVIVKTVQEILLGVKIDIDFPILYVLAIFGIWLGGYVWVRSGFLGEEQRYNSENNPYFREHMEGKK